MAILPQLRKKSIGCGRFDRASLLSVLNITAAYIGDVIPTRCAPKPLHFAVLYHVKLSRPNTLQTHNDSGEPNSNLGAPRPSTLSIQFE